MHIIITIIVIVVIIVIDGNSSFPALYQLTTAHHIKYATQIWHLQG
jgi:hypothetical protein